jgi:aspartate racemase
MKKVGIIGGLAPQSTTLLYSEIVRLCQQREKIQYPSMLINSLNLWEVVSLLDDKNALIQLFETEIQKIQDYVDFIVIPCNTVHFIFEEIRARTKVPILGIHEEVAKVMATSGVKKVGILGTKTTVYNKFYQTVLGKNSIECAILDDKDELELNAMIFDKMVYGKNYSEMHDLLKKDIGILTQAGCDGVILGCTELPLFITQAEVDIMLFPSTQILAASVVQRVFS